MRAMFGAFRSKYFMPMTASLFVIQNAPTESGTTSFHDSVFLSLTGNMTVHSSMGTVRDTSL
jgi:hypothetical protein